MGRRIFFLTVLLALLLSAGPVAAWSPVPPSLNGVSETLHSGAGLAVQPLAADQDFGRFFLKPDPINATQEESVTAVDSKGGVHVAFSSETSNGGLRPAYYAYCPGNCQQGANWTITAVGDLGFFGEMTTLALDPAGHPRMMWFRQTTLTGNGTFHYAECNANCTNPAGWTQSGAILQTGSAPHDPHFFALDPQGRPRFAYQARAPHYVICDSGCTNAVNWHDYPTDVEGVALYSMQLAFTPQGHPRMLSIQSASPNDLLVYSWCDAGCEQDPNWHGVALSDLGYSRKAVLRLDAQGRPRIALYPGQIDGQPGLEQLFYGWNDASPADENAWHWTAMGLPTSYGLQVQMALDANDRPHLAFNIDDIENSTYGLGYARCTANCQSDAASWESQLVETTDNLQAEAPIAANTGMGCKYSVWMEDGEWPSIAVDAAGNPVIAHYVEHMQSNDVQGSSCYLNKDYTAIRIAAVNTAPATPTAPASVTIGGQGYGVINTANTFTAAVSPGAATTPLTYEWTATGQAKVTHSGGVADSVTFTWPTGATGSKTVTVSVKNAVGGPVTASRTILITTDPIVFDHAVYLPALLKK